MTQFLDSISAAARLAPESGIVELVNRGRLREGLLPLWVGEGDLPTPAFIVEALQASLKRGETFYTWQRGIPALREALARYHARHFGRDFAADRFIVTGSGMQAIQLAIRALAGHGDEALYLTPAWPNFAAAAALQGVVPVPVPLEWTAQGFRCDLARLKDAVTPRTRILFLNTPANPSGWTADLETLAEILALARARGLWIIADEIYNRFYFGDDAARAPSMFDVMQPDDRVIFVNSFSKNWAMTGWRAGWIVTPPELGQVFENLVQYSTSGVPQFIQAGAVAALDEGDAFVDFQVARARQARDILMGVLGASNRVTCVPPDGAFYLYFSVDGWPDGRAAAIDLLDKTGLGLAPGTAFGAGTEGFMRLCFARDLAHIRDGASRLQSWLAG
ncbi:MAG: pyridoxal phosphate-dependent aminotransferase [Rhizobiaceae bacterium]|jgi:aspartate/methionine/tyrosine aminotransferase|nr:pyridoxal phosphate-dependent aminotransferase [Rhizobiaceae bacterium]